MDPTLIVIVNNHKHEKLAIIEREKTFRKVLKRTKFKFLLNEK